MKTNENLQRDVQNAIKWEPLLNAAEIGVTARDGIVTLTGTVDSFGKKSEAENAAKNVAGVKAVVEEIKIVYSNAAQRADSTIAVDIIKALKSNWIPDERVQLRVENGWVTLEGNLPWNFQKDAVNKAAKNVSGVLGVNNEIVIKPASYDDIESKGIQEALSRNWSLSDQDIRVKVKGDTVSLEGIVHSHYQREEANRIAWSAPGVAMVNNRLLVEFDN